MFAFFVPLFNEQEGSPFIVCMTYAFQTPEKLCFILDLMNGGDLHYHLSQHGVFSEKEVRFYATEVILGLEHMHNRFVVYRDLKVSTLGSTDGCTRREEEKLNHRRPVFHCQTRFFWFWFLVEMCGWRTLLHSLSVIHTPSHVVLCSAVFMFAI